MAETFDITFTIDREKRLGGFHSEVATATSKETTVTVSSGIGLGHLDIYVSVDGSRQFTVSAEPLIRRLISEALDTSEARASDDIEREAT